MWSKNIMCYSFNKLIIIISTAVVCSGCAPKYIVYPPVSGGPNAQYASDSGASQYQTPPAEQGVVTYIWEEPMTDVVDVPPGLDPEGHYYRRAHQAVVEVRQGKWKYQP